MIRTFQKKKKKLWLRLLPGFIGVLLILQSNPAFCACLAEDLAPASTTLFSSEETVYHANAQTELCPYRESDRASGSSDSGNKTCCPVYPCPSTCSLNSQTDAVLASTGPGSPRPILHLPETPALRAGLPDFERVSFSDLSQLHPRSNPIFILYNTFRI